MTSNKPLRALGRLAVIVLIAASVAYLVRLYWSLASDRAPRPREEEVALEAIPEGPWRLGESTWGLRAVPLTRETAAAWLERRPRERPLGKADPLEAVLLGVLRVKARPFPGGLALDRPNALVRVFVRGERLLEGRAVLTEGDSVRGVELTPEAATASAEGEPLLPWPAGSERLALRRDEDGATVAEMRLVKAGLPRLTEALGAAGWTLTGDDARTCRGPRGEAVWLWAPAEGGGEAVALAIRAGRKRP